MAKEISFYVLPGGSRVSLEVEEGAICSEVVQELLYYLQIPPEGKGAWHLTETWRGCERRVAPGEQLLPLIDSWRGGEGRLQLRNTQWKRYKIGAKRKRARKSRRSLEHLLRGKRTHQKLRRLCQCLRFILTKKRREYRGILFSRLAAGEPLWGPREPTVVEVMRWELNSLREENLQLCISDLNISSTRLVSQLVPLHDKARALSEQLSQLQGEVMGRREERERQAAREMADTQTQMLKLKRELDIRNRMNTVQNSKLQSQKELLAKKRQIIAEKQQELAQLNRELAEKQHARMMAQQLEAHMTSTDDSHMTLPSGHVTTPPPEEDRPPTPPQSEPPDLVSLQPSSPTQHHGRPQTIEYSRITEGKPPTPEGKPPTPEEKSPALEGKPASHQSQDQKCDSGRSTPETPTTPQSTSQLKHRTSSTSKKRHHSIFEAKTKQLVEEEGLAFRTSQMKLHAGSPAETSSTAVKKLEFDDVMTRHNEASDVAYSQEDSILEVPKPDERWYETRDSPEFSYRKRIEQVLGDLETQETGKSPKKHSGDVMRRPADDLLSEVMSSLDEKDDVTAFSPTESCSLEAVSGKKAVKRVRFTAEAVILNAALGGELEVLKQCIRELGSCSQTSDKGATCLHNAVCSGSYPTVEYLVEMGCDINAQDVDGWSPLHCAVAYSNLEMIHYLLENGASLSLETKDGETPLKIGVEEYELSQEAGSVAQTVAEECLKYLIDIQNSLGTANGGLVYTLFSHKAGGPQELTFLEGDELRILDRGAAGEHWWLAENERGKQGYVPATYLGIGQRYRVIL